MTIKQIVETIRQFHPQVSSTQIKILLNMGIEEFCRETDILHGYQQFTTDASAPIRYNSVLGIVTSGKATHTVTDKLKDTNFNCLDALIIRTLPNTDHKKERDYMKGKKRIKKKGKIN